MENIFLKYPEFITDDIRTNRRSKFGAYTITTEFQYSRHNIMIPPELVAEKSVLDVGSCISATGAWVLSAGAKSYTGIERQGGFAKIAKKNLTKYFNNFDWEIVSKSYEEFFIENKKQYDVVIAFGIIYSTFDFTDFIKQLLTVNPSVLVIDSTEPAITQELKKFNRLHPYVDIPQVGTDISLIELGQMRMPNNDGSMTEFFGARPNEKAYSDIMRVYGWETTSYTNDMRDAHAYTSRYRYYCVSKLCSDPNLMVTSFAKKYDLDPMLSQSHPLINDSKELILEGMTDWKFDRSVAKNFLMHARMHIPDYERVTDLSVRLCRNMIPDQNSQIVEVGSAIGHTLSKLKDYGFSNVIGVEASEDMISCTPKDVGTVIHSSTYPILETQSAAVILNWTLHFIKDKLSYLQDIYSNLKPGGFVIVSDKVYNDGVMLDFYHFFKLCNLVSQKEIEAKHNAVKDIMYIDPPEWYFSTLSSIGFKEIRIINATPCFVSFMAFKGL